MGDRVGSMRLAVALALAFALAPAFAQADAPPVAIASASTTSARVNEPVVFTSSSYDPDGAIVATTWEDWDGRLRAGNPLTMRMPHVGATPTLVTITMRATDDAGATGTAEVQVLVRPTRMLGRATAVSLDGETLADTGDVDTTRPGETYGDAIAEAKNGQLRVAGLDAEVRSVNDAQGSRAVATASVGLVHIPHPLGFFHVTGVEAESLAWCDRAATRTVTFGELRFNDAPLVPPGEVPPGTVVEVAGTTLLLNVQETLPDGSLAVTAIRAHTPLGAIEVARASAGVVDCPFP